MDWPGEKLLLRLWDTIEKSGTGLLRPWQLKRIAKAEADAESSRIFVIAAAEKRIAALRAPNLSEASLLTGSDNPEGSPSRIEPTFDIATIPHNAKTSQTIEHLRREINIEKAIAHAESTVQHDNSEPPDKDIDMDWFFRWREYAGGMSSNDLQQLWGNVLAGELKAPGLFPYRTLDFLRNLSQDEAKLIERLATTVIDRHRVVYGLHQDLFGDPAPIPNQLMHHEMVLLEELGILTGTSTMGYVDSAEPFHRADGMYCYLLACGSRGIVAASEDPKKRTGLAFYRLTKLGMNVLQLVQAPPDETFLRNLGEMFSTRGFKVEIGDVIPLNDGKQRFCNSIQIPPSPLGAPKDP